MKIFVYLSLLILFASCNHRPGPTSSSSFGAEKDTVAKVMQPRPAEKPEKLSSPEAIRAAHAAVVSAIHTGIMDSVSFKYNCNNEKRGTVTCFSEAGQPRMLRHSYSEYDHYEATDQYFVKDSMLFFVFSKEVSWSFDSHAPKQAAPKTTSQKNAGI